MIALVLEPAAFYRLTADGLPNPCGPQLPSGFGDRAINNIPKGDAIQLNPEVEKVVYSQNRRETECSACGRFIGSWERCPFCRHWNPKRWQVRILKYSMPILTVVGLFLLGALGRSFGVQPVKIKDLGRKSNYAQVRLAGRVSDDVRFHAKEEEGAGGSLEFELDDGTDTIRIRAYDDVSAEVQAAGKVPGFGDQIEVIGSYQYKARRHFIILGSAADLQIQREKPETATPLAWIRSARERGLSAGQRVKITGRVQGVFPGTYDRLLVLEDPAGATASVSVSAGVLEARGADDPAVKFIEGLKAGDWVTCIGTLAWKKSRTDKGLQLAPAAPDEVMAADETAWRNDNGNP